MKNMKKLIPALAMLVLSAVMMSTASFAWFSMNTEVKVDGISVDAVAPVYISIKKTGAGDWGTSLTDTNSAKLIPADASADLTKWLAIDPNEFVTTTGGGVVGTSGVASVPEDIVETVGADGKVTFDTDPLTAFIKLSYDFTLQNSIGEGKKVQIYLKEMILSNTAMKMKGCLRVAITNEAGDVLGVYGAGATDTYKPLKLGTDVYEADTTDVSTVNGAVNTAGSIDTVTYTYAAGNAVDLPVYNGTDNEVTLNVYIWFEGQDADCINANANGGFGITLIWGSEEVTA